MLSITRWAGKHPLFVRVVLLPVLFYIQGHLAFTAGARLFFDGIVLSAYWVWVIIAVIWAVAFVYPANARSIVHIHYWRIKGLEWVACTMACGLWIYIGNDMAQRFEGVPVKTQSTVVMGTFAMAASESTLDTEPKSDNMLKKAYRNYFKQTIKEIKRTHRGIQTSTILEVLLGLLGIGVGIIVIVCSIQCSSVGAGAALGVIVGFIPVIFGVLLIRLAIKRNKEINSPKPQT